MSIEVNGTVETIYQILLKRHYFDKLSDFSEVSQWHRTTIDGEPNLMLITCLFANTKLSIGVRNSGTQAKISVSARLEHGGIITAFKKRLMKHVNYWQNT